jgi:hypothetical protein
VTAEEKEKEIQLSFSFSRKSILGFETNKGKTQKMEM